MASDAEGRVQPTDRTMVHQAPTRAIFDRETIYRILDEALVCHIGFVDSGQPCAMLASHWRMGD